MTTHTGSGLQPPKAQTDVTAVLSYPFYCSSSIVVKDVIKKSLLSNVLYTQLSVSTGMLEAKMTYGRKVCSVKDHDTHTMVELEILNLVLHFVLPIPKLLEFSLLSVAL